MNLASHFNPAARTTNLRYSRRRWSQIKPPKPWVRPPQQTIQQRIDRGVAYCCKRYGPDWYLKIRLEKLNMEHGYARMGRGTSTKGHACVLAQLSGCYMDGLDERWGITSNEAYDRGFTYVYQGPHISDKPNMIDDDPAVLTEAWKMRILGLQLWRALHAA